VFKIITFRRTDLDAQKKKLGLQICNRICCFVLVSDVKRRRIKATENRLLRKIFGPRRMKWQEAG
jgi:hypothetical protein